MKIVTVWVHKCGIGTFIRRTEVYKCGTEDVGAVESNERRCGSTRFRDDDVICESVCRRPINHLFITLVIHDVVPEDIPGHRPRIRKINSTT